MINRNPEILIFVALLALGLGLDVWCHYHDIQFSQWDRKHETEVDTIAAAMTIENAK